MKKINNAKLDTFNREVIELLTKIVDNWEKLDLLLKAEWHFLLKNDFSRLYKIFEAKKLLSNEIARNEKSLSRLLISKINSKESIKNNLSKALIELLGYKSGSDALLLLKKRNKIRQLVSITNERIILWLRERLAFFDELSEILSGKALEPKVTYSLKNNTNGSRFHISGFNTQLATMNNMQSSSKAFSFYKHLQNNQLERAK